MKRSVLQKKVASELGIVITVIILTIYISNLNTFEDLEINLLILFKIISPINGGFFNQTNDGEKPD